MALPINVKDLIFKRVVENARVEYKRDWNPEPIIHSICAFANDIDNWGGGYIIIGIEEENGMPKFPIEGIESTAIDRIQKELLNKLLDAGVVSYLYPEKRTSKNQKICLVKEP